MTFIQILLTLLTVFLLSAGQVLFKYASGRIDITNNGFLFGLLFNPAFIVALIVYAFTTVLWMLVLKTVPLKTAYPFTALAFFIVPTFAAIFLGESLEWTTFAGASLIILGVYVSLL
ncbi:EamA family transporter [Polynucleobacter sp. UB-Raua-W9]|uniref:EamA family transporter n=1 Tax=Polynucleobacter sp. UB-Raua-W9 TaxID=1819736 RepID=UPI001BFE9DA5|nr:EamA family transporter [Polynucleobacter sp. UB-Raua-W9]